jgi:hypothetical protein
MFIYLKVINQGRLLNKIIYLPTPQKVIYGELKGRECSMWTSKEWGSTGLWSPSLILMVKSLTLAV